MAMLMIISFHCLCFYTHRWWILGGLYVSTYDKIASFLDTIDLPMFFFISGYLFCHLYINNGKYRSIKSFIIAKSKRLLIPYVLWGFFLIITMPSLHKWQNLLTGISHLWFLLVLFEIFALVIPCTNWLCTKDTSKKFLCSILIAYFFFLLYQAISTHHAFLCIQTTLYYMPFFLFGMYCARFRPFQNIALSKIVIILLLLILGLTYYILFITMPFFINFIIVQLFGITITVCLFLLFNKICFHSRFYHIISHLDRLSMGIYIFNQITINIFISSYDIVNFLNINYIIGPFVIWVIGFIFPLIISYFFNKTKYLKWTIG